MADIDREAATEQQGVEWIEVDARLRHLARQSAALDWEIGCALLLGRKTRAHERLGYASLFEYVERLFGYSPRVTAERLRVAEALRDLPELCGALRGGELSWSAVREVTRVATGETDREWLDFATEKTVRELEQAVSGLRPGDRPGARPDPHLVRKVIRVEVSPEGWSLFKDAMARLRRKVDERLTEEDAFVELCRRSLGGAADTGTPPYQVALTLCDHCGRTWQDAGGETVELPPEVGERATCDAQLLAVDGARPYGAPERAGIEETGSQTATNHDAGLTHVGAETGGPTHVGANTDAQDTIDVGAETAPGANGRPQSHSTPPRERATRTIPPATRRQVIRRDRGRCRVPACRNHTWLDLHHIRPRAEGGDHAAAGLLTLCGTHHALHHAGLLLIEGTTEQEVRFAHADGTPYTETPRPVAVQASAEAYAALRGLGFSETESRQALATARTHVGASPTAEELITAALLRHQPQGRAA